MDASARLYQQGIVAYEGQTGYYENWERPGLARPQLPADTRDWQLTVNLSHGEDYLIHPSVAKVSMGLDWDKKLDIDGSAALINVDGSIRDNVWWSHLTSNCGSVKHSGDNLTGKGDGYDEVITVDMSKIPLPVHHILFTVTIYTSNKTFSETQHAFVDMMHGKPKHHGLILCRFPLADLKGRAMLLGMLSRKGAYWNFHALGIPATGRTIIDLVSDPNNLVCLSHVPTFPPELRRVSVNVLRGIDLIPGDVTVMRKPTSDPYFKLQFKKKVVESNVQKGTVNPQWSENDFILGLLAESESKGLKIHVYDHDESSSDEFLGAIWIPGFALYNSPFGRTTYEFDLSPGKRDPRFNRHYGKILVSVLVEAFNMP